jgi:hypothetical protein
VPRSAKKFGRTTESTRTDTKHVLAISGNGAETTTSTVESPTAGAVARHRSVFDNLSIEVCTNPFLQSPTLATQLLVSIPKTTAYSRPARQSQREDRIVGQFSVGSRRLYSPLFHSSLLLCSMANHQMYIFKVISQKERCLSIHLFITHHLGPLDSSEYITQSFIQAPAPVLGPTTTLAAAKNWRESRR